MTQEGEALGLTPLPSACRAGGGHGPWWPRHCSPAEQAEGPHTDPRQQGLHAPASQPEWSQAPST